MKRTLSFIPFFIFLSIFSTAQSGALDLTFNPGDVGFGMGDGINNRVTAVALQTDGKSIVAGNFTEYNNVPRTRLARLNVDGSLDLSFIPGTSANNEIHGITIQTDGKIVIVGAFTMYNGVVRNRIARLNPDGSLDAAFTTGIGANNDINIVAIQTDGKIIIGGKFTQYTGITKNCIARLNSDGSLDPTFSIGTGAQLANSSSGEINDLAIQTDDKIIIGGFFHTYNGNSRKGIARINANGSIDLSFNSGTGLSYWSGNANGNGHLKKMGLQSDGKIIVCGGFYYYNNTLCNGIARINSDGSIDLSFIVGTGITSASTNYIQALAIQADGKIIVAGPIGVYNGTSINGIARIDTNGSLDLTFNPGAGVQGGVYAMTIQNDSKILLGGGFGKYNNTNKHHITRIYSDGTVDFSFNINTGANNSIQTCIIQDDGKILIAGYFGLYNNTATNKITRLNSDGSRDNTFNSEIGADQEILSFAQQTDGKIIIVGRLTTYDNFARNRIARINVNGSLDTTFHVGTGTIWHINKVAIQDDGQIIIVGVFTHYNGVVAKSVARLNQDGTLDLSFSTGTGGAPGMIGANDVAFQSDGKLIVVGNFTSFNGIARSKIVRLNTDGSVDLSFDPGMGANSHISHVFVQPDDKIVITGNFSSYNGTARTGFARLNSDGSIDPSFAAPVGSDPDFENSAYLLSNGKIIGTMSPGSSSQMVVLLNSDGSLDASFNSGVGTNKHVFSIQEQSDGKLIVCGDFTSYDNVGKNRITRLIMDPLPLVTGTISPVSYCSGANVSIPYTVGSSLNAGNIFTAQLSDTSGSFASPVNIGTLSSTTSGSIAATIPSNTSTGSNYRIRVVSSNPAITGTANVANITITNTVSASVTILDNPGGTICSGTNVDFTATPVNGGGAPVYQWQLNGANVGGGGALYSNAALTNGNTVRCILTSNLACVANNPDTSNVVVMSVNPSTFYYLDNDGDGFGNPLSSPIAACSPPVGRVADNTDCCDSNADINPLTQWWQDTDGDGYGGIISTNGCIAGCSGNPNTIPYYPAVHGGAPYVADCNDAIFSTHPGAAEICINGIDDDCDGLINEGCNGIANDNFTLASFIVTNNANTYYPNCQLSNGSLLNANVSSQSNPANVAPGGGRDVWYKFVAPSIAARIKVEPIGFNAVIELRTAAHPAGQVDVENINPAVGGKEILNTTALIVGQTYYVAVRNYDVTNVGSFSICISPILPSGCGYTEPVDGYPLCGNFKAIYRGATNYTFNFTGTGGTAAFPFVTTSATTTGLIPMSSALLDLHYGGEYNVRVDANFSLLNGLNLADPLITLLGNTASANCSGVSIIAHPLIEVKLSQRCPAVLTRSTYLIGTYPAGGSNVCGATSFTFRFTEVDACSGGVVSLPIEMNTNGNTPYLMLAAAFPTSLYPFTNIGNWKVEIRPNFSYGSGNYGPAQYIQVNGTAASFMLPSDDAYIDSEKSLFDNIQTGIFPNPCNGTLLNVNVTGIKNDVVTIRVMNSIGKIVYSSLFIAEESLNTVIMFDKQLSDGLYLVEFDMGDHTEVEKLIVEQ